MGVDKNNLLEADFLYAYIEVMLVFLVALNFLIVSVFFVLCAFFRVSI